MISNRIRFNGLRLKAWVVYVHNTGVIRAQSGHIASITNVSVGSRNFVFNAGTFNTTNYLMDVVLPGKTDSMRMAAARTLTTMNMLSIMGGALSDAETGDVAALYFYEAA